MSIKTEEFRYKAGGLDMIGHLAIPEGASGPTPGVLVFPEALGISEHNKEWAERIARECGYVALACDLHGNAQLCETVDEALPLLKPLLEDPAKVRDRTVESLEALAGHAAVDASRTAAIGFCIGGTLSLELAMTGADIKTAIGLHSRLAVNEPAGPVKASLLALIGADDPIVPPEQRAQFEEMMTKAGADWQLHLFGGVVHSYTNPKADQRGQPESQRYDAHATARAWKYLVEQLGEAFA